MLHLRTFAVLASLLPSIARADSDGYFCVGKDYIAYQFGMAGPPVAPHHLFVVRLDPARALLTPVVVQLPQFQVHGMRCHDAAIEVASFDSTYTIQLNPEGAPTAVVASALPRRGQIPQAFEQRNLARLSSAVSTLTPERLSIRTEGGTEFILEITPAKTNRECVVWLVTKLIRSEPDGRQHSFLIWSGEGRRDCGDH